MKRSREKSPQRAQTIKFKHKGLIIQLLKSLGVVEFLSCFGITNKTEVMI